MRWRSVAFALSSSRSAPPRGAMRGRRLTVEPLERRTLLAALPTGFTETAIAVGINSATAMEIAPNGDVWVLEQGGDVKRFRAGKSQILGFLVGKVLAASGGMRCGFQAARTMM